MAVMHIRDPIPYDQLIAQVARTPGLTLSQKQLDFLKAHDGHENIHIEGNRVFCRTCNARDQ